MHECTGLAVIIDHYRKSIQLEVEVQAEGGSFERHFLIKDDHPFFKKKKMALTGAMRQKVLLFSSD